MATPAYHPPIFFFDGECIFCSKMMVWLIQLDRKNQLYFCPLNSPLGKYHQTQAQLTQENLETALLWYQQKYFTHSMAILKTIDLLPFPIRILALFRYLPRVMRDPIYRLVAKMRHRFTKNKSCHFPNTLEKQIWYQQNQHRFLWDLKSEG